LPPTSKYYFDFKWFLHQISIDDMLRYFSLRNSRKSSSLEVERAIIEALVLCGSFCYSRRSSSLEVERAIIEALVLCGSFSVK
jgi:hypothetical protein